MPNTKSAKKALRASSRKREFNVARKAKIKTSVKLLRQTITRGGENVQELLSKAFSALDKAAKSNTIPKKRADRKKARLAKMLSNKAQ